MQWPKNFTPFRFAAHDFNRSLRVWRRRIADIEILKFLTTQRSGAIAAALRSYVFAIVGALWLSTSASATLPLKIQFIDISIPSSYVNFAVAVLLYAAAIHVLNYFVLNAFVTVASNKLFKFDAPWALTILQDGGNAWSIGALRQFRFFLSGSFHARIGLVSVILLIFPTVAILLFVYWTVIYFGYKGISNNGLSTEGALSAISLLLIICPLVQAILLSVPFEFEKNRTFVRWNFLFPMHRRLGTLPLQMNSWLGGTVDSSVPTPNPPSA